MVVPAVTTLTYDDVHKMLRDTRGSASEYRCAECGDWAHEWAYQHSAGDSELYGGEGTTYPYSTDPSDYAPMCKSCHRSLDQRLRWQDPAHRANVSTKARAQVLEQWKDPEFRAIRSACGAAVAGMRRKCADCGQVSNPSGVARHQRASGHTGYRDLPSKTELAELMERYL